MHLQNPSNQGRGSGGILVFVNTSLNSCVTQIECNIDNSVCLKVNKEQSCSRVTKSVTRNFEESNGKSVTRVTVSSNEKSKP